MTEACAPGITGRELTPHGYTAGQAKPKLLVNELSKMEFLSGSSENLTGQRRSTGAVGRERAFAGGHVCDIAPDQPHRSRLPG